MKSILQDMMKTTCYSHPISENDRSAFSNVSHLQRYHPGLDAWSMENVTVRAEATLPHPYHITAWKGATEEDSRIHTVELLSDSSSNDTSGSSALGKAFVKIVHLLDPITLLKNEYMAPSHPLLPVGDTAWKTTLLKLHTMYNQAYVDAVASYVLGILRHRGLTPHGCLSYGSFTGIASNYHFKITDEYSSYRQKRWFWRGLRSHSAELIVEKDGECDDKSNDFFKCPFESIDSQSTEEVLDCDSEDADADAEIASLHSFEFDIKEETPLNTLHIHPVEHSIDGSSCGSSDESSNESASTFYDVTLNFPSMPVILICQEAQEGTLDALLDNEELRNPTNPDEEPVQRGTAGWDRMWLAWLFQIIGHLAFLQKTLSFTHNDLHTNNVVWRKTEEKFLYYKVADGQMWRVPTYGRIFSLIDFGRAIFKLKGALIISDDHWPDHDAGGQYNFGPFYSPEQPKVVPNPSFDLCRLAISMLEGLYSDGEYPSRKKGSHTLLSQEGSWKVYETVSPLFNLLWTWTLDDDGQTVYEDREQEEKYPGFSLYCIIAQNVHDVVPSSQLRKPVFEQFKYKGKCDLPVYSIG